MESTRRETIDQRLARWKDESAARRETYDKRLAQLKSERATWDPALRDIGEQMLPYRVMWDRGKRNSGEKAEGSIINNTPVLAIQTLAAGMMAGITSPARQWFALTTEDPQFIGVKSVKSYVDICRKIISADLAASNWYTSLANGVYVDLGAFGTSALFLDEGPLGELRFHTLPVGQYYLDANADGDIEVCYRELDMSVRQIVRRFGLDRVSQHVKRAYQDGNYSQSFTITHAIQPNDEYKQGALGRHGMMYRSCWWEQGEPRPDWFLHEGGYHEFPILAPRWSVRPGDVYGRGPGWQARGDCRQLQHMEKRFVAMLDKTVNPPMRATDNIRKASLLPGDVTHVPRDGTGEYEPAMTIDPKAMDVMREHIDRVEWRIKEAMYVHLWQSLIEDERNQRPTATEVEAKRQEIMLMLGPLLENLNDGLLEPAITRTFNILERAGRLPPPPPELEGQALKVEFISIMHQMQQSTGLSGIQTMVVEAGRLAQLRPDALDKLDGDVIIDELAKITGVNPDSILSKDEVMKVRRAKADQAAAEQGSEQMSRLAQGIGQVGGVDPNNLQQLAAAMSPVAAAAGGGLPEVLQ